MERNCLDMTRKALVGCVILAALWVNAAMPEKKIVLYGWDTGEASLETVLANADKFADTGN